MKKIIVLLLCLLIPASIHAGLNQNQTQEEVLKATVIHPLDGFRKEVRIGDPNAFVGGYILETPEIRIKYGLDINPDIAGAVKGFRPSGYSTTLASFLADGGSESTLTVSSLTLPDGTTLNDSYYGDLLILTIGEGDSEEKISISTLNESTKTFTIIDRGHEYGRLATVSTNIIAHYPGDIVFVSNDDHFLNQQYVDLDSDQTIAGTIKYTNYPEIATYVAPIDDEQFAPKKYIDDVAIAGGVDGTETTKGLWEGATRTEMASSTATGGTSAGLLLKSEYASSSPDVRGINVVVSENDGYIDSDWLRLSDDLAFSGTNTHSGENTFSATTTMATTTISKATIASTTITTGFITDAPTRDNDIVNKTYVDTNNKKTIVFTASDTLQASANTERSEAGTSYVKVKEILLKYSGTVRCDFDLKSNNENADYTAHGKVYINGAAQGAERGSHSLTYETQTAEDFTVTQGDLFQLYINLQTAGGGILGYTRNFRVYWTETLGANYIVNTN